MADAQPLSGRAWHFRRGTHHPELHELYDLAEDPYEMRNVVREPRYETVRADLQQRLGDLVVEALALAD